MHRFLHSSTDPEKTVQVQDLPANPDKKRIGPGAAYIT
jgi:hypothetical protein